jgi:hypothetical protein
MLHSYTRKVLFHYTTKEVAIERILHNLTIKLGSIKRTNDLRETDPWTFGMIIEDNSIAPSGEESLEITKKIDENLKQSILIACFTQDQPDLWPERGDPDKYVREDLGPQGYEHDRMWAQYAGNHTGVCIFFDREELTRRIEQHFSGRDGRLLHGPVSYVPGRVDPRNSPFDELSYDEIQRLGVGAYARQHRERFANQLYLTKNLDWASEQEYRFVWVGDNEENKPEFVSIEGCINAVCLGGRFPEAYKVNVQTIKDSLDIELYQICYLYGMLQILPLF